MTCNRYPRFYKEQYIEKSSIVLRTLWDIVIDSECDFGIKTLKNSTL